jgi:hypothetical protein
MIGTINCIYETPCGWCTKWDKKCDSKLPNQYKNPRAVSTKSPCDKCAKEGWDMPECKECTYANKFKYFEAKENTK